MDLFRLASVVVVGSVNLWLARVVYVSNRKSATNRSFAAAVTAIVCWLVLAYLSDQPLFRPWALPLNQLTFGCAVAMEALLLYFVLVFPRPPARLAPGWRALLASGAAVVAVTSFTPLVVAGVVFRSYGTDFGPGPLFPLTTTWIVAGVACIVTMLTVKLLAVSDRQRAQMWLLLLGLAMSSIVAVMLGLIVPILTGSYQLSALNTFASLFIVGFVAYAMVRHRLMDIRFVVLRTMAYSALTMILGTLVLLPVTLVGAVYRPLSIGEAEAVIAGCALVAIFLFQPLQRLLEHMTDDVFHRRAYRSHALLLRLTDEVAAMVEVDDIVETVTSELVAEMQLVSARIALPSPAWGRGAGEPVLSEPEFRYLLAACKGHRALLADELDAEDPVALVLAAHELRVAVPLLGQERSVGLLLLGEKRSGDMYSDRDVRFLELLAPAVAHALRIARLFEERKWNAAIVDCSNDAIIGEAPDGTIISWNRAAELIYGYTAEEIVGSTMARLTREEHRSLSEALAARVISKRRVEHDETQHVRKDGREIDVSITLSPIQDSAWRTIGISAIVRDISERRQLEQAKDDFIAMLSHELRTPLTAIIGYASLLDQDPETGGKQLTCATRILERGRHMQSLIEQLLLVLQATHAPTELHVEPVDLASIVRVCADALPEDARSRITVSAPKRIRRVACDPDRIAIAISNLLGNAAKFSRPDTTIAVTIRYGRDTASVSVADSGIGIPADSLESIFDRFTQADMSSTRSFGGFGLGLYIVKKVMDEHGGLVEVESEPGVGSTFTLRLPLATRMHAAPAAQAEAAGALERPLAS